MLKSGRWARRHTARVFGFVAVAALLGSGALVQNAQASRLHATTITLWSGISGSDQTGFKKIIDGFNSSQSAVQVEYDQNAFTGYDQKLTTALSAGKGPTIWTGCAACQANNMAQGQIAQLDKLIKSSKVLNAKNFDKPVWKNGFYKGHQYLIPLDTVPLVMYYNKSLLKKAGFKKPVISPPSKVLAAAKKLTKGSDQYGMVIPTDWPMQFVWPTLLAQFGGKPFNSSSKTATFNSQAGVKALTYLKNLIYQHHVGPDKYAVDQDIKMLANGSAAQIFDGIWMYTNATLQTLGSNEGISEVPQFGPKHKVFIGDLYFALYKKNSAADNKAAIKFLEYFQTHSIEMAKVGPVPTYKPVIATKAFKKLTAANVAAKELKYGVLTPPFPGYDDHWLYDDALWPVLRGQTSDIKGSLDKAAEEVTNHMQNPSG